MSNFFFKNPLGKFVFDVFAGGVIAAGLAAVSLSADASVDLTLSTIFGAFIGGVRSAAASAVLAAVRALRGDPSG